MDANGTFGRTKTGEEVGRFTIRGGGLVASILTYGAVIQDLRLDGHDQPLVLGFDNFENYLAWSPYFGATPGRCANRIAKGRFELDGALIELEKNEKGIGHLHGGSDGIAKRNWRLLERSDSHVRLAITDPEGRAGYPGNAELTATYSVGDQGRLTVRYEARTDRPTPVNLCQHSYFNLDGSPDILGHELSISAESYLPVDAETIPTGEDRPVEATPFDFRRAKPVGTEQLDGAAFPYDHNFCLSHQRVAKRPVARLRSPLSGVTMEVLTTEPGMQFYAGFKIRVPVPGLEGKTYGANAGLCLETQVWPDAVNHETFPNAILRPGEKLVQETDFVFSRG
nr:aldose epimerase family protein [uncultured Gellertiella sp.]